MNFQKNTYCVKGGSIFANEKEPEPKYAVVSHFQ